MYLEKDILLVEGNLLVLIHKFLADFDGTLPGFALA